MVQYLTGVSMCDHAAHAIVEHRQQMQTKSFALLLFTCDVICFLIKNFRNSLFLLIYFDEESCWTAVKGKQ